MFPIKGRVNISYKVNCVWLTSSKKYILHSYLTDISVTISKTNLVQRKAQKLEYFYTIMVDKVE